MKTRNQPKKKSGAQAMVEFALVLPLLLMVMYGLIETGRYIFIYSSAVTAARSAVRYGSASGENPSGTPYYNDCAGIIAAAKRMGIIQPIIIGVGDISYDTNGTVSDPSDDDVGCPGPWDPTNLPTGGRIMVEARADYSPIVSLLPFKQFTIRSQSARTVLGNVIIEVVNPPPPNTAWLTLEKSANRETFGAVGETITYTYKLINSGTVDLSPPYTVTDDKVATVNCPGMPNPLTGGNFVTCTGTYTVTQADLDAGFIINNATATAKDGSLTVTSQGVATVIVTAEQLPKLSLEKSASPVKVNAAGQTITYTYTLRNTGNVNLMAPYTITDDKIASISCSGATTPLIPGASTTCTGTHVSTEQDMNAGAIINHAVARATFDSDPADPDNPLTTVTSNQATATVMTAPITLTITPSPTFVSSVGQVITYTYTIRNISDSSVTSPSVTDNKAAVNCSGAASPLAPGASTTCTGTYTVTQADLDAGLITNEARATAMSGADPVQSALITGLVTAVQTPQLTLAIQPSVETQTTTGPISYTYALGNSGNVTLKAPFTVIDNKTPVTSPTIVTNCTGASSPLAPGTSTSCTGSYTVVQADLDAGAIVNHAIATARTLTDTVVTSAEATATVITFTEARLKIQKAANQATVYSVGSVIGYTYTLTNTGGKELTSPAVSDNNIDSSYGGHADCSGALTPIPLGSSTTCQATRTLVQGDIPNDIINQATATAYYLDELGVQQIRSSDDYYDPPVSPASATVDVFVCDSTTVTHNGPIPNPTANPNIANWTITNNTAHVLHISTITVTWTNKRLTSIQFPVGTQIWSGNNTSPVSVSGNWTLNTGATTMRLTFPDGTPRPSGIVVSITFSEFNCPAMDSIP